MDNQRRQMEDNFCLKEKSKPPQIGLKFEEEFDLDGPITNENIRIRKSRQRLDDFDEDELSSIPSNNKRQLVDGEMEFDDPDSNNKLNQAFE